LNVVAALAEETAQPSIVDRWLQDENPHPEL
jgi:hypothetical protein